MKSKYETLCSIIEYVKNESYNPIAELLLMGFTPAQLVHEFAFDEEKVKACPLFLKAEENLDEKLEEEKYPQMLQAYSFFDAALMERFHLSKEKMRLLKETDLYYKIKEAYRQEKEEAFTDIMHRVCDRFQESLTKAFITETPRYFKVQAAKEKKAFLAQDPVGALDKTGFLNLCIKEKNKLPLDGIKAWEYAIQQALESLFPDKEWYELTNVSIFTELLSGKVPIRVCEQVWEDIKDKQFKMEKPVKKESLKDMILHAKPQIEESKKEKIKHDREFTL